MTTTSPPNPDPPPQTLALLSTFRPASTSRTWLSTPHHTLPLLATASSDKTVRIYSLTSFTLLSTISGGHKRSIRTCAWKPNTKGESVLATGSFDASAGIWRRWDTDDGLVPRRRSTSPPITQGNGEHKYNNNDDNNEEEEEDDDEWRFSVILDGHESEIKSVAWSAGGTYLATCSRDKSVWIWEEMEDDNFETIAVLQEHEGDVKCVVWHPCEELLVSASYDDTIRFYREDLDDWACVGVCRGHESTVWAVDFEPLDKVGEWGFDLDLGRGERGGKRGGLRRRGNEGGPRLVSCSDDQTVRVWRRNYKEKAPAEPLGAQSKIPSIIRTGSIEEDWVLESILPRRHERAIYSVAWSKRSGRIVSAGGDGKVVVYGERLRQTNTSQGDTRTTSQEGDQTQADSRDEMQTSDADENSSTSSLPLTEWIILAELNGAHGVFEVNHVCWVKRFDRGKREDREEEMIITTGDDGEVKAWLIDP